MLKAGSWATNIILCVYGTVATSLVTQSVPVVGDISHEFDLPRTTAGWMISIPSLVTAIGALFGGWLIDRLGDKRVLLAGSLFGVLGNLGVFFAHDTTMLFASRLVEGIAYLSLTVGAVTMLMRTTSGPSRSIALGLWTSHTAVGIGITLMLVSPLAGHGELWRWAFGGHAVIMAALALLAFALPSVDASYEKRRLADILLVIKTARPYRVALASAASAFIQTGIMAALTVYFTKTFAIPVRKAGEIGTLAEVFVVAGCFGIGHLLKSGMSARLLALAGGLVTLCGGMMLYVPSTSLTGATVAICAFSLGVGLVNGLIWTLVPGSAPSLATMGITSGLVAQATYIGVLLGPPAIFSSLHEGGWTTRLAFVAVACVLQLAPLPIWRLGLPATPNPSRV